MRIVVVGTGYVGLVTGTCLAEVGHEVSCLDVDEERIGMLRRGESPMFEPRLAPMLQRNLVNGQLSFESEPAAAYGIGPDVAFICVGTPTEPGGDQADLGQVEEAVRSFRSLAGDSDCLLVIKSTAPPGTCRMAEEIVDGSADVAFNPEFLAEGRAVEDFMKPDRIVVGARTEESFAKMRRVYRSFVKVGTPILEMETESAEMTKYASNAHLAARVSLMNELARLCDETGADIEEVRLGVSHDRRVGRHFLYAGIGFGGSCFPKDLRALRAMGADCLVDAALRVNAGMPTLFARKAAGALGADCLASGSLDGKVVGVWGLSFKPQTSDVRESQAAAVVREMIAAGAAVKAYDPEADPVDGVERVAGPMKAVDGADALLVLTEWPEFKNPNWTRIAEAMRGRMVCDGRNLYDPTAVRGAGLEYVAVGRSS